MYSARKNKQQTKVTQKQGRKIKCRNHTSADPTIKKGTRYKNRNKIQKGDDTKNRTIITMTKVVVVQLTNIHTYKHTYIQIYIHTYVHS